MKKQIINSVFVAGFFIASFIPSESVEATVLPPSDEEELEEIFEDASPQTPEERSQSLIDEFSTVVSEDFGFLSEVGTFIEGVMDSGGLFGTIFGGADPRSMVSDALEQVGLTGVFGGIDEFLTEVGTYINIWGAMEKALGIELDMDIIGVLGLPDPNETLAQIEAALRGEVYGANGELPGESYYNLEAGLEGYRDPTYSFLLQKRLESYSLYDQTTALADQTLSSQGQESIKKQQISVANSGELIRNLAKADQDMVGGTESLADDSRTLSDDSENTDVTQNIMRNQSTQMTYQTQALANQSAQMANQSAQLSELGSLSQQQLMLGYDAKITRAYQSKILSDIAKQEQRKGTRRRRENVAASRRSQMQGAISGFGGTIGSFDNEEGEE